MLLLDKMINGESVPDILLSGDHNKIERWRKVQSLKNTQMRRPDLIDRSKLTEDQIKIINDLKNDLENL